MAKRCEQRWFVSGSGDKANDVPQGFGMDRISIEELVISGFSFVFVGRILGETFLASEEKQKSGNRFAMSGLSVARCCAEDSSFRFRTAEERIRIKDVGSSQSHLR